MACTCILKDRRVSKAQMYLDHNATTPIAPEVKAAMAEALDKLLPPRYKEPRQ